MHIVCVNQYYWPEVAATGQLLQEVAEDLVRAGHHVTVICGRSGYAEAGEVQTPETRPPAEIYNGVHIRRVPGTSFGRGFSTGRVADYLTFHLSVIAAIMCTRDADVMLAETTPPLILVGCIVATSLRRVPTVHVVQDLYPDVAEALGAIKAGGVLSGVLRRVYRWALHHCAAVIVLGRDMANHLAAMYGVRSERLWVIPNWADRATLVSTAAETTALRNAWKVGGRKVVMYAGNLGRAHTFAEMIQVAERWGARKEVVFVFVGAGHSWDVAQRIAENRGLSNTVFLPYQDKRSLGASLAVADVHLVTQKKETLGLLVPSKLYAILTIGRPVVFVGPAEGEVAKVLAETGAGLTTKPGDVEGFEAALNAFLDNRNASERAAAAGRKYMASHGNRHIRTRQYRQVLEEVART